MVVMVKMVSAVGVAVAGDDLHKEDDGTSPGGSDC